MYRNRSKASLLVLAAIAAALLALTGCQLTRNIGEDEFEHLEAAD